MTTPIGIDLGTTNCCVAYLEQGRPEVIKIDTWNVMPSIIAQARDGTFLIGRPAKQCANPAFRYGFVKREMGGNTPYAFRDGPLTAVEISAKYLAKLKEHAESDRQGPVAAIVTVPAHFEEIHLFQTRQAAELAGLDLLGIIREPEAAAIAYHHERHPTGVESPKNILVYDLGGGTMDATVCIRDGDDIRIAAAGAAHWGDQFLGGYDFDKQLVSLVMPILQEQGVAVGTGDGKLANTDSSAVSGDPFWYRIFSAAERIKMDLSAQDQAHWNQELSFGYTEVRIDQWIERSGFEEAINPLLSQTIQVCEVALDTWGNNEPGSTGRDRDQNVKRQAEKLDILILVGGSTRMPAVKQALQDWLSQVRTRPLAIESFREDECVAIGAAFEAAQRLRQRETPVAQKGFNLCWDVDPPPQVPRELRAVTGLTGRIDGPIGGGWSLRLCAAARSDAVVFDEEGRFKLPTLDLRAGENKFELTLGAPDGTIPCSWGWVISQGGLNAEITGLARPINVRLVDGEETILPPGTKPDTVHARTFYIQTLCKVGDKRVFRLPLYEGYHPIGSLEVEADAPAGTPVVIQAAYQPGALRITAEVSGKPRQELPYMFKQTDSRTTQITQQERFYTLKREIEDALSNMIAEAAATDYMRTRWLSLLFDLHTEFEGRLAVDKAKIDDRLSQAADLLWHLKQLGNSADSLRANCNRLTTLMRDRGVHDERLQEAARNILKRLEGDPAADVLASVGQEILELRRGVSSRIDLRATDEHVKEQLEEIRRRLATIREVFGEDQYKSWDLPNVSRMVDAVVATMPNPDARLNRLWAIDQDCIREHYHSAVLTRDRSGLLARSA